MQAGLKRYFYLTIGFFFLLLGVVGIFVPLLPTTPFLILTAICFNKSSDKFHAWLLNHRILGPPIIDWQKNHVIRRKYKVLATVMMLLSSAFLFLTESIPPAGKISFAVFVVALLGFLWSQKSEPK